MNLKQLNNNFWDINTKTLKIYVNIFYLSFIQAVQVIADNNICDKINWKRLTNKSTFISALRIETSVYKPLLINQCIWTNKYEPMHMIQWWAIRASKAFSHTQTHIHHSSCTTSLTAIIQVRIILSLHPLCPSCFFVVIALFFLFQCVALKTSTHLCVCVWVFMCVCPLCLDHWCRCSWRWVLSLHLS